MRAVYLLLSYISLLCFPLSFSAREFGSGSRHGLSEAQNLLKSQPVNFTENKGQLCDMAGKPVLFVLFKAETPGMDLYITEKGLTYVFWETANDKGASVKNSDAGPGIPESNTIKWERIDMSLKGASILRSNITTSDRAGGSYNFFFPHCPDGIYGVSKYAKLTIKDVYPGIDWVFYNSTGRGFKYDFIVHPGADPKQIELAYSSLEPLQVEKNNTLALKTAYGILTENEPYSYLEGTKQSVQSSYRPLWQKKEDQHYETCIGFDIIHGGAQDKDQTLVIDPQQVWATFFGGALNDVVNSVETDPSENLFITGYTASNNFPVQYNGTYYQGTLPASSSGFITKFSNNGALLWSTFYGGSASDGFNSVTTDQTGNVYVTGFVSSSNCPVQNAGGYFQSSYGGGHL